MSQVDNILRLLMDGLPHSTVEILNTCYNLEDKGIARIGARIYDLRKRGYKIQGVKDVEKHSIYWYTLVNDSSKIQETKPTEISEETGLNFQSVGEVKEQLLLHL